MEQMGAAMPFDGKRMIYRRLRADCRRGRRPRRLYRRLHPAGAGGRTRNAYREMARARRPHLPGIWRDAGGRGVGRRRARRQGHRLSPRREGRGRREHRLFLDRMAVEGGARRRLGQGDGRRADAARRGRQGRVRRPAHVLGRLPADRSTPPRAEGARDHGEPARQLHLVRAAHHRPRGGAAASTRRWSASTFRPSRRRANGLSDDRHAGRRRLSAARCSSAGRCSRAGRPARLVRLCRRRRCRRGGGQDRQPAGGQVQMPPERHTRKPAGSPWSPTRRARPST